PNSGKAVIDIASKYLGIPYVYGGTTPSGFDCSGLVQYVYRELGYNLNRVAADQMNNGRAVSRAELQPGDIVGFYSSEGGGYVGHIGIYAGDGMMIHAPRTGDVVKYASIDSSYYASRFAGGRRIIN
ncbi:MAG: C40 family peptidase, partial [Oscillospiraceae bacterium]